MSWLSEENPRAEGCFRAFRGLGAFVRPASFWGEKTFARKKQGIESGNIYKSIGCV